GRPVRRRVRARRRPRAGDKAGQRSPHDAGGRSRDQGEESRMTSQEKSIVTLRGVSKTYERGDEAVRVLEQLDLEVPTGSYEALMGPSGSGKTTLLNLIAGLDRPSAGTVEVAGQRLEGMGEGALAKWRSSTIGFVFQSYNLLP